MSAEAIASYDARTEAHRRTCGALRLRGVSAYERANDNSGPTYPRVGWPQEAAKASARAFAPPVLTPAEQARQDAEIAAETRHEAACYRRFLGAGGEL